MSNTTRRLPALNFVLSLAMFLCVWLMIPLHPLAAVGDVNYISDVLNVPLRSGPSTAHRIVHRGLPSGTQLTILAIDEEAGFTQVRTKGGMEGWLTSQYLIREPIARVKLAVAENRLKNLKAKIDKEREARSSLQGEHKETVSNNKKLNSQVKNLSKELEELKLVSADPIKEHARNVELTQKNALLISQLEELSAKTKQLEDNVQLQWLLYGGALVLIGVVLGLILKGRSRQQMSFSRYSK